MANVEQNLLRWVKYLAGTAMLSFLAVNCARAQAPITLDGIWQFRLAKSNVVAKTLKDFYLPSFEDSRFKSIPVPSNWAVLGFEEPVYRGFAGDSASEGFYIKEFTLPKDYAGKRVLLHFGGVWSSAEVWLNGQRLGLHHGGYSSFAFNVTGLLKSGSKNKLAVLVRQVDRDYKFDVNDDWTLGGIFRSVYLEAMPAKRWMDPLVTRTSFDNQFSDAKLNIEVMVNDKHKTTLPGNYPSPGKPYKLSFKLFDSAHKTVAEKTIIVPAHISTGRLIDQRLEVDSAEQWNAEHPYLYHLQVDLLEDGTVVQTRKVNVGFRQISTEGGIFKINGHAVKLRGVNRHDEYPDEGRATTRRTWLKDLTMMKAANINYIRSSHYCDAEGFLDLCDSLGMYVGDEVSLGGAGDLMLDPSFNSSVLTRTYETVTRDRNQPCVIYWSIGNEDPLTSLHMASIRLTKALDPTRPVLIPWQAETWLPKEIDILAPHYWQPEEYDSLAAISGRPIITTEYDHAYGLAGMGSLEDRWHALTKHASGAGGAVWMWADQGIKTPVRKPENRKGDIAKSDPYLRLNTAGWDGIVDSYRQPTRDYYEVKAVYAPVYPVVKSLDFIRGQQEIAVPIQNDYDFTNLDQIAIEWALFADGVELDSGNATTSAVPHSIGKISVPLKKLMTVDNSKTYYLRFVFYGKEHQEITRRAVTLNPPLGEQTNSGMGSVIIVSGENRPVVRVADLSYTFDKTTGQLISAQNGAETLINELKPIIWTKLDNGEASVIGSKIVRHAADLNHYQSSVSKFDVEKDSNHVVIDALVHYKVDGQNSFDVKYKYVVDNKGRLNVHYILTPHIELPALPLVGMSLKTAPELSKLRWFGLGPYNAYPNKDMAPILGLWADTAGGNKATRWFDLYNNTDRVRVINKGYLRTLKGHSGTTLILSRILGRPE